MRLFGEKIGIAFQMKDDLLDYGDTDIGQPTGIDLKEKKLMLIALPERTLLTRSKIITQIKNVLPK